MRTAWGETARPRSFPWKQLPVLLALIAIGTAQAADARQEGRWITPDDQFALAEAYFEAGDYFRAIGEYQRFVHFFPEDPKVPEASFMIGLSHFHSEQYESAIGIFSQVISRYGGTPNSLDDPAVQSRIMAADAYMRIEQPDRALGILNHLLATTQDRRVSDETLNQVSWVHIELGQWKKASRMASKISPEGRDRYDVDTLLRELENVEIPQKKPELAGFLSLVPGLGQLYVGRYRDALTAFLFNAGLILASVEAFDNGNEALGTVIGFVETGFYSGNIYGAISGAHKYNRAQKAEFIRGLRRGVRVSLSPAGENGLSLSFHLPF